MPNHLKYNWNHVFEASVESSNKKFDDSVSDLPKESIDLGKDLLSPGSHGPTVSALQKILVSLKYLKPGYIESYFDKRTYDAVRAFQRAANIQVDGLVGPGTRKSLSGDSGASKKVSNKKIAEPVNKSDNIKSDDSSKITTKSSVTGSVKTQYGGVEAKNIDILIKEMESVGITNPNAQIGILTVIGKESNYIPKSERMSYSKERLPEVWGIFSKTGKRVAKGQGKNSYNQKAVEYAENDEKLANFVYGQRGTSANGMRTEAYGNVNKGDGYKYRGRGFNQITFKKSYKKMGEKIGIDLVANPDKLNDPRVAAKASVRFLMDRLKQKNIDPNSFNSTKEAVKTFAHANAGWGRSPSHAIANATKYLSKFDIA